MEPSKEAVVKRIEACTRVSQITRTALGPKSKNKLVINRLAELFVTNDTGGTILNENQVQHPSATTLVLAGKAQQEEIGDGANLTISFAGELLEKAKQLIIKTNSPLLPSEIVTGYRKAEKKAIEILAELVEEGSENMDVRDKERVILIMKSAVASKQFGQEDILCPLIAEACIQVCPQNPKNFNVDNVRVAKLLGGDLDSCTRVRGMVLKNDAVGSIKKIEKAKVAVFVFGLDTSATETEGTVLIHRSEQLENYSKTEEAKVIKAVAESGAKVIVTGGNVGKMALRLCESYKLMVLKISSKFELRRFCRTIGAVALVKLSQPKPDNLELSQPMTDNLKLSQPMTDNLKLSQPTPEKLGYVDSVSVQKIGGVKVTIVRNEEGGNTISTVVLRGSTDSILDDLERAVDNGVNTYKAMCRDSRIVPGAAATEMELCTRLSLLASEEKDKKQYQAVNGFAESFKMVPKTLAENAGLTVPKVMTSLYGYHSFNHPKVGIDLREGVCKDVPVGLTNIWDFHVGLTNIWDLHVAKFSALKYAVKAACTVLELDKKLNPKPAGGPRDTAPAE